MLEKTIVTDSIYVYIYWTWYNVLHTQNAYQMQQLCDFFFVWLGPLVFSFKLIMLVFTQFCLLGLLERKFIFL